MMTKRNQILAAILAAQIVLAVVLFWPRSATQAGAQALLPDLEPSAITALTVQDPDGAELTLRQESGVWVLPNADSFPVKADKIQTTLEKLTGVDKGTLVTKTESSHRALQVSAEDFARRVTVASGGETYLLYLGSSPSYGATHVRLDGQAETYLAQDLSSWDITAQVASWIDPVYVNLDTATISRVSITNANGELVLLRDSADQPWTVVGLEPAEGQTVNQPEIDGLVRAAGVVRMNKPLGKSDSSAYGMDTPAATIIVEHEGGAITLLIGAQDPVDLSYVVKATSSPYYVGVSEYAVKSLVEASPETLVQDIPEPAPDA